MARFPYLLQILAEAMHLHGFDLYCSILSGCFLFAKEREAGNLDRLACLSVEQIGQDFRTAL